MGALEIRNLKKSFGAVEVLRGIDFSADAGEFVCLLGPSGCGKSTLLRCIAGLEVITSGSVEIEGRDMTDVPPAERNLAMVFQSYALYPHLNVRKNMGFGLSLQGMKRADIESRVGEAARILEIGHLLDRKPRQLSGGQRQRVAIGRAIVRDPSVFLFDEPLSNLDAALRTQTRYELARLHKELGRTMLFVTHDQIEAMTLSTKVVVLNAGRVEQVGRPMDLYRRPANRFVAGFIGSPQMNFLPATLRGVDGGAEVDLAGQSIGLPLAPSIGADLSRVAEAGLRPEHLRIVAADQPGLAARVVSVERLGAETLVFAKTDAGQALVVRTDGASNVEEAEAVTLAIDPGHLHFFDREGVRVDFDLPAAS
jgi:multiple sugar transport system ATP-binding protein